MKRGINSIYLKEAAIKGDLEIFKNHIKDDNILVHDCEMAIWLAVRHNNLDIVEYMVENSLNYNLSILELSIEAKEKEFAEMARYLDSKIYLDQYSMGTTIRS